MQLRIARVIAGFVLVLLALLALALASAWAPDRSVDTLAARWASPPSMFLELDGMLVHLRDEGPLDEQPPIMLLHGTSASLHTWDGWTEALAGQRRVLRVDLPGFGLTGPFPHDDYDIPSYLDFIAGFLDALEVQQAVIAGNSFGGQLAWEFAVEYPERVAALVLVDAAGYPFRPDSVPLGFRVARMPLLRSLMQNVLPRSMIESSVRNVYGDPERVDDELVDRYYELTLREGNRRALGLRLAHAIPTAERAARIPLVTQPTLILWGAQDRLIPPDNARQFAADISDNRLVIFEHLGHVPHEEAPGDTVAEVIAFLEQVAPFSPAQ